MPAIRRKTREPRKRGGKLPPAPSEVGLAIEGHLDVIKDVAIRSALNASRTVRIFGARYANPLTAFWKNEHAYSVGVMVEIVRAGPLGATAIVDGFPVPADTVGGRSAFVAMDPNESLSILFSDASIEGRLVIRTPKSPRLP